MKKEWRLTVWGVRGSVPRPSGDCMKFGGNTVCTSLEYENHRIILDAGTGLWALGQAIGAGDGVKRLDILLSHFHIDHVLGIFSFQPLFDPEMEIHFYGAIGLRQYLGTLISPPFWPLKLQDFPARLKFHEINPGDKFSLEDLDVSTMAGSHPGGSILYRLEGGGKSLTYALDCERDGIIESDLIRFVQKSDLLIWDATFTSKDLCPGWGHSTWEQGIEIRYAAKAGQVLMTHYSQNYTDEFLCRQEEKAAGSGICRFAKEGMVMIL